MNDDLEHTLRDSLDQHASGASHAYGNLHDVVQRVELRRRRRRSLAVIASASALVGGVIGFAAFAARGPDRSLDLAAAAPSDGPTTTAMNQPVFACSGYLGTKDVDGSGPREIYDNCDTVLLDEATLTDIAVASPNCFMPTTTMPLTPVTSVANAVAEVVTCFDPAGVPSQCFPNMTTTTATTSIPSAIATTPSDSAGAAVACATYESTTTTTTTSP